MPSTSDLGPGTVAETLAVPLLAEELSVARRTVVGSTVRVATVTHERKLVVDEALTHERVEVERVPIGCVVDAVPPVRTEGDITIMPVVEEVVVVERRLVLKEEVRIRRVRVADRHCETIVLREQDAEITRVEAGLQPDGDDRRPLGTDETPLTGASAK